MAGGSCRIGVGGICSELDELPRSYREAVLSLRMGDIRTGGSRVAIFDQLGVYRILAEVEDTTTVDRFVREWLGPLIEYDARRNGEMVATLSRYLECGRSHGATADALSIHRSTLKYRLQRIREISGHDLSDPDTSFNLQLATRAWQTLAMLGQEGRRKAAAAIR